MNDVPVKSVKKALDLLNILAFEDPSYSGTSLKKLAEKMNSPANSVHNLLKTMVACNYADQLENGKYVVGPRCRQLSLLNKMNYSYKSQCVDPVLKEIVGELNEAAVFTILCGGRRILAGHVDNSQMVKIDKVLFESKSIYELPTGRILIIHADPDELDEVVDCYGYPGDLWEGISSMKGLAALQKKYRESKYIVIDDEKLNLWMVAVPVTDKKNYMVGALGVYAPRFRCPREKQKQIIRVLTEYKSNMQLH